MARIMAILGLLAIAAARRRRSRSIWSWCCWPMPRARSTTARFFLQRQGYAAAITHPEVLGAIEQGFDQRIAVTYVEWGDARSQDVVVPWTIIDGKDSAAAFADDPDGAAAPRLRAERDRQRASPWRRR